MNQELITVKQLPVIEERLQSISEDIQAKTSTALALEVTESTVKEIKKRRTALNKSFNMLEEQRKSVKAAVMAPYEAFEEVYKKYVTDIFKPADKKLKARIDEVENTLLENKKNEVVSYFQEAAAVRNIDFVLFDDLDIKVLLSDSMKKLHEQVDKSLDKIAGELEVITTLDYPEEILVEYKDTLNLTSSILTVKKRKEKLAAELQRKAKIQKPAPAVENTQNTEPAAPVTPVTQVVQVVAKEPEPETTPEVATVEETDSASEQSLITITIKVHSCGELMAITDICKARKLEYTIS